MIKPNFGNYYDDLQVNDEFFHPLSKTIFESDNNIFSLLTMNHHPIHTNAHYAKTEKHEQILVVGTLIFSLVVGMTVPEISGKAIANLEYLNIKHINPVFIGDTIYAKSKILDKYTKDNTTTSGVILLKTIGYNQNGIEVIEFQRRVLLKNK
jgi:acyl dehydratase